MKQQVSQYRIGLVLGRIDVWSAMLQVEGNKEEKVKTCRTTVGQTTGERRVKWQLSRDGVVTEALSYFTQPFREGAACGESIEAGRRVCGVGDSLLEQRRPVARDRLIGGVGRYRNQLLNQRFRFIRSIDLTISLLVSLIPSPFEQELIQLSIEIIIFLEAPHQNSQSRPHQP